MLDVYEHGLEGFPRRMILGAKRSWADLREGRLRSWVPDALVQPCVSAAPGRHVHIDPGSRAFLGGSVQLSKIPREYSAGISGHLGVHSRPPPPAKKSLSLLRFRGVRTWVDPSRIGFRVVHSKFPVKYSGRICEGRAPNPGK